MSLTSIPFSSGDALDTLTSVPTLKYDSAASTAVLSDFNAPTITGGCTFSLSSVNSNSTLGATSLLSANIGTSSGSTTSVRSANIAGSGNTITASMNNAIMAGTNNSILTTSTNNVILASVGCTVNVGNASAIVASDSCTQTAVANRSVIIGSSTIINSSSGTLDQTGIYNCLGNGMSTTGIAGINNQSAVIASGMPLISSSGSRNAIVATLSSTISGSTIGSIILGGNTHSLSGNYSAILGGESNTVSAANAVAIGKNMTVSASGSLGYCDHTLASSTLSTADAVGIYATNGVVVSNVSNSLPDSSAVLTLASTTKGFLKPRLTTTQKNAISSPVTGLAVYDSTLNLPNYYNGINWVDPDGTNNFSFTGNLIGALGVMPITVTGTFLGPNNEWVRLTFPETISTVTDDSVPIECIMPSQYSPATVSSKFIELVYNGSTASLGSANFTSGTCTFQAFVMPALGEPICTQTNSYPLGTSAGFYQFTITYKL